MKTNILGSLAVLGVMMTAPAALQAQPYGDPASAASTEIRMQEMEREIRKLTGQIEEQDYKIRQLEEELQRVTGDLGVRVRELEGGSAPGGDAPGYPSPVYPSSDSPYSDYSAPPANQGIPPGAQQNEPQSMTGAEQRPASSFQYQPPTGRALGTLSASESAAPQDTAAVAYERAFSLLKASDFDAAEVEFSRFITTYPDHVLMPNAKYWYGETFYVRGNYEKSARIFAEGYRLYPKGAKAPDNLLKLGMSLAGLGKKDDACVALAQLKKEYAGSAAPVLHRGDQEMTKLGCK